jgi:hypothetical protein
MNFMEAIQFPLKDEKWLVKVGLAIIAVLVPLLGWLVLIGYGLRLVQNVLNGIDALPEWDDLASYFSSGLTVFLGTLIYQLPNLLISCLSQIVSAMGGDEPNAVTTLLACCLSVIQLGLTLVVLPLTMSATANYAVSGQFSAYTDFGARFNDITSRLGDVVMLWVNLLALGIIAAIVTMLGLLLVCLPGLFAIAFFQMANYHMTAQWGRVLGLGGTNPYIGSPQAGVIEPLV